MQGTADQGLSLANFLQAMPEFIPNRLLCLYSNRNEGIRLLRCVSREFGSHALKAVVTCSMNFSDSVEVLRLLPMLKHAKLLEFKVDVGAIKDVAMEALRTDLKTSLKCVVHLQLCAQRSVSPPDQAKQLFALLAAALPALQQLTLTGANSEIGLPMFGACCPQLRHVKVHFSMVPLKLVHELKCLPNLQQVTVSNGIQRIGRYGPYSYMDSLLKYVVRAKINLKILDVECRQSAKYITILSSTGVWNKLPTSLAELRCSCEMFYCFYSMSAQDFMGRLKLLTLHDGPYLSHLLWILKCAPQLEEIVILTDFAPAYPLNLTWDSGYTYGITTTIITPEDMARYKEKLKGGFQFVCACVSMSGLLSDIDQLLTWLTPQPTVTSLFLAKMQPGAAEVCRLAERVFPNLKYIKLV